MPASLSTSAFSNSVSIASLQSHFLHEEQRWLPDEVLFYYVVLYCSIVWCGMCINVCACESRGQQSRWFVFFSWFVLETEFLTEPGNLIFTRLTGHQGPGILCLCLHSAGIADVYLVCSFLHGCWASNYGSCICGEHFTTSASSLLFVSICVSYSL